MSSDHENHGYPHQQLLERLVDGELSGDERCHVLAALELQQNGWRRCALAFLESQSIRSALRDFVGNESAVDTAPQPASLAPSHVNRKFLGSDRAGNLFVWSSLAACILCSFVAGLTADRWFARDPARSLPVVENQHDADVESPASRSPAVVDNNKPEDQPDIDADDPSFVAFDEPSIVPREIERVLARLGHRVERRRGYVPLQLRDGRRAMLPVEQVDFMPVRWETY